ncbi:MAG: RagB/SusD family nutrient uptake outer membrane protein [Bacteroidota bacterium]|nr:RagB/SusD family nutrient uptake outer membrane protein [Bacteroidota bacterium]
MKNLKNLYNKIIIFFPILLLAGCSKDFLDRPPKDSVTDASFYKTDEEVLAATSLLYSKVWFDYNDKASYNLGDFRAGTAYSAYNDRGNVLFHTTGDNPENLAAWSAFFNVVGQSNLAIQNINKYAGSGVSAAVRKQAIAECHFMRALAYRYLVMNWGEVPVITNNLTLLSDTTIQKNTGKSVWKFITNEMSAAAEDLPENATATGRLTKWSAEGMLARFYLTRAGVEASGTTRKQEFLDSAKYYAERVIKYSGASLVSSYANLFLYPYDNNSESLFELQWAYTSDWGYSNTAPAYLAYSSNIAVDGWGGDKSATWWMLKQYDGINSTNDADTVMIGKTLDQRLKATFMLPGAYYSEINKSSGGFVYPAVYDYQRSFAAIKKYVVGKPADVGGNAASQRYPNDTYMLRLAEMYLVYAEAALGNNTTGYTKDGTILEYFNKVHTRAGLPAVDSVSWDMIFKERIIEFAMEGMGWYDFVNLHYYNPDKAFQILNSQDRGVFAIYPDVSPNPTQWKFVKTPWSTTERQINAYEGNFLLPIPSVELLQAPNLLKPAVDYYATKK